MSEEQAPYEAGATPGITEAERRDGLARLLWEADRHSIHTLRPEYVHPHRTSERHHEYQRVMADYLMRHGAEVAAAILGTAPPGYRLVSVEVAETAAPLIQQALRQFAGLETWAAEWRALSTLDAALKR